MPRPLRVFLCHASQDKPAVRKLHRYLKQHGIDPWLDEIDLLPGENWEVEIPRAIDDSDVILVCLSKNSINKEGYVQKEISFALDKALEKPDGTIFIIPAKLEDCEVPKRLNRFQWVDLFRPDSNKRLLLGLNKRVLSLGTEVSPVIVDDTRQRKPATKPVVSDLVDLDALEVAKRETAEKLVQEKVALEKAEQEKQAREKDERLAREQKEREEAEKAALEKAERKTAERLAQEKADQEKTSREKAEREVNEKAEQEERGIETAESLVREQKEHEAREKTVREKAEREKQEREQIQLPTGKASNPINPLNEKGRQAASPAYKDVQGKKTAPVARLKFRWLGISVVALALMMCMVFGGYYFIRNFPAASVTPAPTRTLKPVAPSATKVIPTAFPLSNVRVASDENGTQPTTTFTSTDTVYVVGDLANVVEGTQITSRWYAENVPGVDPNFFIDESAIDIGAEAIDYVYFFFPPPAEGWPAGTYKVEVYFNGVLNSTVNFTVQ